METIRVISATVHEDTNEVEIIIEKTKDIDHFFMDRRSTLHALWIDCEMELDKSLKNMPNTA